MTSKFKFVALLGLLGVFSSHAAMRQYSASVETSIWRIDTDTRLQCTLNHELPGYGEALFTSMASKQLNMEFELDMHLLPNKFDVAAVYSVPPK